MTADLLVEERRATVPLTAPHHAPVAREWRHLIALLAICLGGLALRIYEFRGFGAVDDAAYAQFAHQIAEGTFKPGTYQGAAVFPLRMGIIYPTALLYRYLGVSEWTMVLFPFVLSVLSILLAYVATKHFFGRRAALIGAAIWAFLPLDAFHAGILVPDLPAAFFASLGVVGLVLLQSSSHHSRSRLFLGGLAAGLAFGISWLCRRASRIWCHSARCCSSRPCVVTSGAMRVFGPVSLLAR
jgi:4-amino-4-deoxy-L-arabinose transferase-like glycosyltransferase